MIKNICLTTDSYKIAHWNQYPKGTEKVYSYFECRKGAKFDETPFFGLQYIIKNHLEGVVVTREKIEKAANLCKFHFGNENYFNREGWEYILNECEGKLPIVIKAVEEGTVVPIDNVLMTIENTDNKCFWLTNLLETILSQIWYPTTVASLSRETKKTIKFYLDKTSDGGLLNFGLQDFGCRGATTYESAGIGGAAHLVNFLGTDTIAAMEVAMNYYNANLDGLAYSVAATEHSIMTALGKDGEETVVENLLNEYPTGILSVVADSYDIYNFVSHIVGKKFKDRILARDGVFVIRPDSITPELPTPELEMVWIVNSLWRTIGGKLNSKGFKILNPKVRVLWGDGIDLDGITKILQSLTDAGFATENVACFGMGGGLLQKVNRDTQRCAFKSSAQCRDGVWYDIYKNPLDASKKSKRGKLKLIKTGGNNPTYYTTNESDLGEDQLKVVFANGKLVKEINFDTVRKNASL